MRLALHTVICCCVFSTVLPLVKGTTGELNTSLKRFKICLQRRMKRDPQNSSETADEQYSDIHIEQQQDGNADVVSPPSSFGLNIRDRRSTSSACFLVTCSYNVLLDTLHKLNNNLREPKAPPDKIGSYGYGRRRRRSLQDVTQLALRTGRQRRSTEAASKVSLAAEIEDNP